MKRFRWILPVIILLMATTVCEAKSQTDGVVYKTSSISQNVEQNGALGEGSASQEDMQEDLFNKFDFTEIDEMLGEIFPKEKLNFKEMITGLITGDTKASFATFKELLWDQFTYELRSSKAGMIHILVLVIIAAVFANFSGVFKSTQVADISFVMLYMMLITICLGNFRVLVECATEHVGRLMEFMKLLGPIYFLAVAIATGSSTSVTFYHIVLLLIFLVEIVIAGFLIPLTQIYFVVRILGEVSSEIHFSKFAELIETVVSWCLKTLLAGVIGFNVIQSLLSPAIDTVKRSVLTRGGEALPLIGDVLGGAVEVVLGTAVLIKNGIGVAGMIICIVLCLAPLLQLAITSLMYQFVAALIQPISDKRMVDCVSGMAEGSKMLLKIVFESAVLFLITIAVVATTTGG